MKIHHINNNSAFGLNIEKNDNYRELENYWKYNGATEKDIFDSLTKLEKLDSDKNITLCITGFKKFFNLTADYILKRHGDKLQNSDGVLNLSETVFFENNNGKITQGMFSHPPKHFANEVEYNYLSYKGEYNL